MRFQEPLESDADPLDSSDDDGDSFDVHGGERDCTAASESDTDSNSIHSPPPSI